MKPVPLCDIPACSCDPALPPCPNCGCRSRQEVSVGDSGTRESHCWNCGISERWADAIAEKTQALESQLAEARAALEEAIDLAYTELVGTSVGSGVPYGMCLTDKCPNLAAYLRSSASGGGE